VDTALRISRGTYGALDYATARGLPMDTFLTMIEKFNALAKEQGGGNGG
jgi:hypothetical protein